MFLALNIIIHFNLGYSSVSYSLHFSQFPFKIGFNFCIGFYASYLHVHDNIHIYTVPCTDDKSSNENIMLPSQPFNLLEKKCNV